MAEVRSPAPAAPRSRRIVQKEAWNHACLTLPRPGRFESRRHARAEAASELLRRSREGNAALMRGDAKRYLELVPLSADFTLMSPFGGTPSRAADYTGERIETLGRFFRNGTFEQELVEAYGSRDMVVLAVIERAQVEVGGLPAQPWALRVTLVYRRDGSDWRLVHRHADPLANGITLEEAAALGRGERAG
jgi:ketosteroid isomerase-like protein